jgi:AraC-like DNA-binding protein
VLASLRRFAGDGSLRSGSGTYATLGFPQLDPRYADGKISVIAFGAGFGDLSDFNRTFRRHYGAAPSNVRAAMALPV